MLSLNFDIMGQYRALAVSKVQEYYNVQAALNAHTDIVALVRMAKGESTQHPAEERETNRVRCLQRISEAFSKEGLNEVLSELGPQYVIRD